MAKRNIGKILLLLVLTLLLAGSLVFVGIMERQTEVQVTATEGPAEAEPETTFLAATEAPTEVPTAVPTKEPPTEAPTEAPTEPPQPKSFLLTFAGDCTLGCAEKMNAVESAFPNVVGDDYFYSMKNVRAYFENDDCSFVNLEGVLGDQGTAEKKKHVFRGSGDYVQILTNNSVEAVTLANNHAYDYGTEGYDETKRLLTEAEVIYAEHGKSTLIRTDSGLEIALYAVNFLEEDVLQSQIVADIRKLKDSGIDLIVCAFHWGRENTFRPTQEQKDMGHAAIDAGANIIWGHHPHVLQPIEEYNGGIIYYSLGNFVFGGNSAPKDRDTAFVQQEIIRETDGTVHLGKMTAIPCSVGSVGLTNNYQPTPYEEGTNPYERVFRKLNGVYTGRDLAVD